MIEVVLGAQFDPLPAMKTPHLGVLWSEWRRKFDLPRVEDRPPLDPAIELFGLHTTSNVEVQVELVDSPPLPRSWFLNAAGSELVQVQQDRLIHNWRRVDASAPYPRYKHIRERFRQELEAFAHFVEREDLGPFVPNQCEVTYVNYVEAGARWELDQVFTVWTSQYSDDFLSDPESVGFAVQFVIPDDRGSPLGRLRINANAAAQPTDGQPMLRLLLTARGRPEGEGLDGVLRFLDRGHNWAVHGFASITTPAMHKKWGRTLGH